MKSVVSLGDICIAVASIWPVALALAGVTEAEADRGDQLRRQFTEYNSATLLNRRFWPVQQVQPGAEFTTNQLRIYLLFHVVKVLKRVKF